MDKLQESLVYNPEKVQELKKLVSQGEGLTLEFKRKATHPEKIVREMIAFANTQGGILLVGVGDDKTIPGLKFPEDESYVIQQALKNCRPAIAYTETYIPVGDNRIVIQYHIPESTKKPHAMTLHDDVKECYVRAEDMSIKASREMREIIQRAQKKKDIRFNYGEHETLLMKYLDENSSITLKQFMEAGKLNRFKASKKLILLTLANVLKVTPTERGDVYSLGFKSVKK